VDPATLKALARHGEAVATARAFAEHTRATRVVLLIDRGDEASALMVDVDPEGDTEVTDEEELASIPAGALVPADPRPVRAELTHVPATAITIDPETGELSAPIGAIEHLAHAVTALAQAFGGRSVATAEFATSDPALPITIAAREGEPPLLSAGGEQFELPG
jgi:hypothetical protein